MSFPLPSLGLGPDLSRGHVVARTLLLLLVSSLAGSARAQDEPPPEPGLFDPGLLRSWRLDFESADWLSRLEQGQTVLADLEVEGAGYPEVGVSEKGNSSARVAGPKQPLNLTLDEIVEGQRLMGFDVVNLNNGFMNPTFTREVLTLRSLGEHMPMPRAGWARVDVGEDYLGLYVLVEQIEGTFLRAWFQGNDGLLFKADAPDDAGPVGPGPGPRPRPLAGRPASPRLVLPLGLAAPDAPSGSAGLPEAPIAAGATGPAPRPAAPDQGPGGFRSALQWQGEDLAAYRSSYAYKGELEGDGPWEALRELTRVLDAPEAEGGPAAAEFVAAIRRVLDVDGALWYLAGQNLFTNFDSYYAGHNYYLYQAEEDGRWHVLAWDQNEAFGVFPGAGVDPSDSTAVAHTDPFLMAAGAQASSRPLIARLLSVPELRADYLAHYRTLRETVFAPAELEARIAAYQALLRDAAEGDPNRLYPFALFEQNVREDVRAGGRAVPGILKVAEERARWLGQRADLAAPELSLTARRLEPETPVAGQPTLLSLELSGGDAPQSVELVYRVNDGAPERLPMVAGPEGGWTVGLPALSAGDRLSSYARAALPDGRAAFFPASNLLHPWREVVAGARLPEALGGPLVVNELLADNESGLADPAGELDDWLELYNRGDEPLALAGYYLSDDVEDPLAYALPARMLAPGEHLLIWCDGDPEQGEDHADFRLSREGEAVLLSTEALTVDRVDFGAQTADVSWARETDGAERWLACSPSPGKTNVCEDLPEPTASATATEPGPGPTPTPTRSRAYLPFLDRR